MIADWPRVFALLPGSFAGPGNDADTTSGGTLQWGTCPAGLQGAPRVLSAGTWLSGVLSIKGCQIRRNHPFLKLTRPTCCVSADGEASFAEPWNDPLLKEIETATHKVGAAHEYMWVHLLVGICPARISTL